MGLEAQKLLLKSEAPEVEGHCIMAIQEPCLEGTFDSQPPRQQAALLTLWKPFLPGEGAGAHLCSP